MRLDKVGCERFGLSRREARRQSGGGISTWRARRALSRGGEIDSETPLTYCPDRPRPQVVAAWRFAFSMRTLTFLSWTNPLEC